MKKRIPQLASKYDCTGCMACVGMCRVGALSMQIGDDGHGYPTLDMEKCVRCLHCEQVCQDTRHFIGSNDLHLSTPYAVWANNDALRSQSTSGGFAAAVSKYFLDNNRGVIGVIFDGRKAKHIYVDRIDRLPEIQGSKYVWSNASAAYHAITENLPKRPVLFTGTGCQVAGVLSCFANHPNRDRLYTIDLICGGVPSNLLMQMFRKTNPEVEVITSFRTKRKYELKGIIDGKEVVLPHQSLPLSGFCAEQTMRYSCYNCPYAFAHRHSDITIGDLWGDVIPKSQSEKGVSLVVVHTKKGLQLLHEVDITIQPVMWKQLLKANKRIIWGHTPITYLRSHLEQYYHHMNSDKFIRIYSNSSSLKHPLEFVFRLWSHILYKLNTQRYVSFMKQIITDNIREK